MPLSMFENLVVPQGSPQDVQKATAVLSDAKKGIAQGVQIAQVAYQVINLLPDGDLKKWLLKDPVEFWKSIITLIKGRRYQTGQYRLGERFIDQVQGGNVGQRDVADEVVPAARMFFTIVFGVRINNDEDLGSLDYGVDAYYNRPNKQDIPREAVERAVYLKQNYYPASTYNNRKWDMRYFELNPLVAPIPEMNASETLEELNVWKLYSGLIPGGAYAVDGIVPIDAQTILKQLPEGSEFEPAPNDATDQQPGGAGSLSGLFERISVLVKAYPVPSLLVAGLAIYAISETDN